MFAGENQLGCIDKRIVNSVRPGQAGRRGAARLAAVLAGESPAGAILSLAP